MSSRRRFLKHLGAAGAATLVSRNAAGLDLPAAADANTLVLSNGRVRRELRFDGRGWRTTRFARGDGSQSLAVESEEFHLLFLDNSTLTIADFAVDGPPQRDGDANAQRIVIRYKRLANHDYLREAPARAIITYRADAGEDWLHKEIRLEFDGGASGAVSLAPTIDRLEVERFVVREKAWRGGRGEPVFVAGWFFGVEYPASHSRHTDGNTPAPDSAHYELVGNYSYIDLESRDREPNSRTGLLRLMHFPGFARQAPGGFAMESKSAVAGVSGTGEAAEFAFLDYLAQVQKPARSFTMYNNYFDPAARDISGDHLVQVYRTIKAATDAYSVKVDALAPDSGWQDKSSIYQPSPKYFPNGMADVAKLGQALRSEGTSLGLWLALDGTGLDVAWGEKNGYVRAQANNYFKRYFTYFSLSATKYHDALLAQLRSLVQSANLSYLKHDFNHLCDTGEGCGHPATDRHGHEANVDAMIEMLAAAREESPAIFQNLTNWMWFSPWWLMHGDTLWMLAGDDGLNGNWPEISTRAMATTDRDTYIWRMWGEPADRPLVPVSRLMTHGIIRNQRGLMQSPQDTLDDWADYVMMHYGRGVEMKEWYITPSVMGAEDWKVLCSIHRWGEANGAALRNTVYVGGRPDEGHAYGYMGWNGERGVLVARNTAAAAQTLAIPFNGTTLHRGRPGLEYRARVVYPYRDAWPAGFRSGETMYIELPGYATMAFELEPGKAERCAAIGAAPSVSAKRAPGIWRASFRLPDEEMPRCDLLVIGYNKVPVVNFGGAAASPKRTSQGAVNHFAGYARSGMPSDKARMWRMAAFDMGALRGKLVDVEFAPEAADAQTGSSFEAWLLLERPVREPASVAAGDETQFPWPLRQGSRRQTVRVLNETWWTKERS
jgi:hypothetical protein